MTIGAHDLIDLAWDEAYALAGAAYTRQALLRPQLHVRPDPLPRPLQQLAIDAAAELAFRRWLESQAVPVTLVRDAPLTDPEHVAPSVGGRWIRIRSLWIDDRRDAARARSDVRWLTSRPLPVPSDWLSSPALETGDLLAFVLLAPSPSPPEARALQESRPTHLLALAPRSPWHALAPRGELTLFAQGDGRVTLELGGRDRRGQSLTEAMLLPPRQWVASRAQWGALLYAGASSRPAHAILVSTGARGSRWRISPRAWQDVWLAAHRVTLIGWCTLGEARAHARRGSGTNRVGPFRPSGSVHLLRSEALRPMSTFLAPLRSA